MNSGYVFTLSSFVAPIPYTSVTLRFEEPVPLILGLGSVFAFFFLFTFVWTKPEPSKDSTKSEPSKDRLPPPPFKFPHDVALCIYSGICFVGTLAYLIASGELKLPFDDGRLTTDGFWCTPTPAWLRVLSYTFILSKFWEWADTYFMIKGGHKSFANVHGVLHTYHHSTTFLLMLIVTNFPSTEKAGMLLNGGVHTIMYYHFAYRLPKPLRPLITGLQIAQLLTLTYIWHVTPETCAAQLGTFPADHLITFAAPYLMVPVYTLLFIAFFVESYVYGEGAAAGERSAVKPSGNSGKKDDGREGKNSTAPVSDGKQQEGAAVSKRKNTTSKL